MCPRPPKAGLGACVQYIQHVPAWPGRQGSRVAADCGVRRCRTVLTAACAKLKWLTSSVVGSTGSTGSTGEVDPVWEVMLC